MRLGARGLWPVGVRCCAGLPVVRIAERRACILGRVSRAVPPASTGPTTLLSRVRPRRVAVAVVAVVVLAGLMAPPSQASRGHDDAAVVAAAPVRAADDRGGVDRPVLRGPTQDFPRYPRQCPGLTKICQITSYPGRPWLVLWGDSHAFQYLAPVWGLAQQRRVNLALVFAGGCPLSLPFPAGSGEPMLACDKHNVRGLEYVKSLKRSGKKVRVILGSWWALYRNLHQRLVDARAAGVDSGLTAYEKHIVRLGALRSRPMFKAIGRAGIQADVLAQAGTVPHNPPACARGTDPYQCDLPRAKVLPRSWDNRSWLRRHLTSQLAGRPRLIDPSPVYCGRTTCRAHVRGHNTFSDAAHLGLGLTRTMRREFRPTFRALLAQDR